MLKKALRLFVIKNRFEAWAIIYAIALGATTRGIQYLSLYPGWPGKLLFLTCSGAVFMAGAKILDGTRAPAYRSGSLSRLVARARQS